MKGEISTSAEAAENHAMARRHDVHSDPDSAAGDSQTAQLTTKPIKAKSPAEWAYERLIIYIQNFEQILDAEHEVAIGFAGSDAGIMRIEGMGFFDPDIITFYGADPDGTRTQLVQHVSQLNVMLRALPKPRDAQAPQRIGFRLAAEFEQQARKEAEEDPDPDA
ncbi:MAG: DUF6173 family protein [Pseudooceanicola sp.]